MKELEQENAKLKRLVADLESVQSVLADGGYACQHFADGVMERLKATVQVVKRNELHTFAVLPKRWTVERSFGWLDKSVQELRTQTQYQLAVRAPPLPRTPTQKKIVISNLQVYGKSEAARIRPLKVIYYFTAVRLKVEQNQLVAIIE